MEPSNFNQYYEYYLTLHQKPLTKIFHLLGVIFTVFYIVWCIFGMHLLLLILAPFVVYPFTYFSHRIFEKNTPASLSNPWMAKLADWKMCYEILTGKVKIF